MGRNDSDLQQRQSAGRSRSVLASAKGKDNRERSGKDSVTSGRVRKRKREEKPVRAKRRDERRQVMVQAKAMWEDLRPKAVDKTKRSRLITQLHELLRGRFAEFVFRHDGSRIVQWMLADGLEAEKNAIIDELLVGIKEETFTSISRKSDEENFNTPFLVRLASDRYGRHLAFKLLRATSKQHRTMMFEKMLHGHVSVLIKNAYGADVLDFAFQTALNAHQRAELVNELLFSRERKLLDVVHAKRRGKSHVPASRENQVSSATPGFETEKISFDCSLELLGDSFKQVVIDSAAATLTSLIDKESIVRLAIVHAALDEYLNVILQECSAEKVRELCSMLAPTLVHLAHTKPGVHCALNCVKILDAKNRKKIVRSMKGHMRALAENEFGHRLLIGLMEWIDDTKLVGKAMTTELFSSAKIDTDLSWQRTEEEDEGENEANRASSDLENNLAMGSGSKRKPSKKKLSEETASVVSGKIDVDYVKGLCLQKHGRMLLLCLLFPHDTRYFNPVLYGHVWESIDMEKFGTTSKKDSSIRQGELWEQFRVPLSTAIEANFSELLSSHWSAPVIIGAFLRDETKGMVLTCTGTILCRVTSDKSDDIARNVCTQKTVRTIAKLGGSLFTQELTRKVGVDALAKLAHIPGWAAVAQELSPPVDSSESERRVSSKQTAVAKHNDTRDITHVEDIENGDAPMKPRAQKQGIKKAKTKK